MDKETRETATSFVIREGSLVRVTFKPRLHIEIEDAERIVDIVGEYAEKRVLVLLIDARAMQYISQQARRHFAAQDNPQVKATALLVKHKMQAAFGNFYLKYSKPVLPTKMFRDEERAIAWLQEFLKD